MTLTKKGLIKYKAKELSTEPEMIVVEVSDGELKRRRRFELNVVKPVPAE